MKKIAVFIALLFVFNSLIYSANQVQTNLDSVNYTIKATTAIINLNITENQTVRVFKDTLLFEEDFSEFSLQNQIGLATTIGGNLGLTTLPNSMTKFAGCKARKLKLSQDNACNLQNTTSKFRTPILSIPDNSLLTFRVKNSNSNSQLTVRDTVFYLKKNIDSVKSIRLSLSSFVEFGKQNAEGSSLLIDDIKIFAPRSFIDYDLNDNILSLQGLTPETKYYIEIVNQDSSLANTYYFTTQKQIDNFSSQILNKDTVFLHWQNNDNTSTLLLSIDSITNVAEDLLISKVATTSSVNVVEIFNPTEKDICLQDYEFVAYQNNSLASSSHLRYLFFERDSIKSNSCILIALNSNISPYDTNLVVYPVQSNSAFSGGNDSYLILKRGLENVYDTIDLFGRLKNIDSESEPSSFANSILIRKNSIRQGIQHNPLTVDSIYYQWDISEFNIDYLNSILGNHSISPSITIHNINNSLVSFSQDSLCFTNVNFDGVYRSQIKENNKVIATTTFRMGKEIKAICSGDWNDVNIWEYTCLPTNLDRVVLPVGVKVDIAQNMSAECAELVINSDYSTCDTVNKAEIRNNGNLLIGKSIVKPYFSASNSNGNSFTFFSIPINVLNKTQQELFSSFEILEGEDLFYLKENFSSITSSWISYSENTGDSNFFKQNLGYLFSYSQNKDLSWEGDLFFDEELVLLNNASFNEQGGNGYHLCANPYPFSVNYNNFSKNNIAGMWVLNSATGQYIPYNPNEPSSFIIPSFTGFMTKVKSNENLLKIHKQEFFNQDENVPFFDKLHLTLSYEGGEDDLKIYFRENASESIDEYDVYKLFSFATAPDLYSSFSQKDLSIVSLPLWQDSVILPLMYKTKSLSNYELKIKTMPQNVLRAELYDNSGNLLIDFVQDSSFIFQPLTIDEEKNLMLRLYSFDLDLVQEENAMDFKIIQNGNSVKIESKEEIDDLFLCDIKGIKVSESKSNEITIPNKGTYILVFKIADKIHSSKIVYLK